MGNITETDFDEVVDNFQNIFAISTLRDQVLADTRDGLKPSQRVAVWSGWDAGLKSSKPMSKTLSLIGHAVGNYYQYGDASLVGLIENLEAKFSNNVWMFDGGGSWKDVGVPAASARYTKVRLSPAGDSACGLVAEGGVEMVPSYDGLKVQPEVLPVTYPHALVNPGSGIAVGFASKTLGWNLGELAKAIKARIGKGSELTTSELMKHVKGPDFPMGGVIYVEKDQLVEMFETGTGTLTQQANMVIEKNRVVYTNFPVDQTPEKIIESINKALENKNAWANGVSSVRDANVDGQIVLELIVKRGHNQEKVATQVLNKTNLTQRFSLNAMFLRDGTPTLCGVSLLLEDWLAFRYEVIKRVAVNRKQVAEERLHVAEGLATVLLDIDKAISIIRTSKGRQKASEGLIKYFKITDIQADYILERRLATLTATDSVELKNRIKDLKAEIRLQNAIATKREKQSEVLIETLEEAVNLFGWKRKTEITIGEVPNVPVAKSENGEDDTESDEGETKLYVSKHGKAKISTGMADGIYTLSADNPEFIVLSSDGQALKTKMENIPKQGMGAQGAKLMGLNDGATIVGVGTTNIEVVTDKGKAIISSEEIPVKGRTAGGVRIIALWTGEKIKKVQFTEKGVTVKRGQRTK